MTVFVTVVARSQRGNNTLSQKKYEDIYFWEVAYTYVVFIQIPLIPNSTDCDYYYTTIRRTLVQV